MASGIGATLREARRRRDVELSEVEAALKIRLPYLQAIESEVWGALPGDAYARGFVRSYANYLGLDGERLAAQYVSEPELTPIVPSGSRPSHRFALVAAGAIFLLAAVIAVAGLSGGDGDGAAEAPSGRTAPPATAPTSPPAGAASEGAVTVRLETSAEVWVCLVDAAGGEVVDGKVLPPGAEEGPFHSGSFTVSFGNGEVSMSVNGRETELPETASPLGYEIAADGELTPLTEAQRPTCL